MHQQINLYQPIFREQRKLFSLHTVLLGLMAVVVVLLGIWGFGRYNVGKLEKAVALLKQQQATQEKMAQSASALFDAQRNPGELQAAVQTLNAQIAERTRALDVLRSGAAGEPRGFALRLEALARRHTEGVWLDEVAFASGSDGLMLRGRCIEPELVPRYLQQLALEPELSGARFNEVLIGHLKRRGSGANAEIDSQTPDSPLQFSVSSKVGAGAFEDHGT